MMDNPELTFHQLIASAPTLYPLALNDGGDLAYCVELSEEEYRQASFLDDRMLRPELRQGVVRWQELDSAATGLSCQCDFLFHISHAGSTLLSRLLGAHSTLFSLREPAILRSLAIGKFKDRTETLLKLWSRTFRPEQRALIKATSFVSEIACDLLESVADSKAILVFVPLETFLPALLDGAMSDIDTEAASRLQRLQRRGRLLDVELDSLSPGECVAMSWFAEMVSLDSAAIRFASRTHWLNFNDFLQNAEGHLQQVFAHLGLEADVSAILAGPIMNRYAKRPEVDYDKTFRTKLLQVSEEKHASEIQRGLAWFEKHKTDWMHSADSL